MVFFTPKVVPFAEVVLLLKIPSVICHLHLVVKDQCKSCTALPDQFHVGSEFRCPWKDSNVCRGVCSALSILTLVSQFSHYRFVDHF